MIERIFAAGSQSAADEALAFFAANFHPGLLSHLDYLELRGPKAAREDLRAASRTLFQETLPENLRQRRHQLLVDESTLARAIRMNNAPHSSSELRFPPALAAAGARVVQEYLESVGAHLDERLSSARDSTRIRHALDVALLNGILLALDVPTTRQNTLEWLFAWRSEQPDRYYPFVPAEYDSDRSFTRQVIQWLTPLVKAFEQKNLTSLVVFAQSIVRTLEGLKGRTLSNFDGDWVTGIGNCGRCSMNFASETLQSIDHRCDFLYKFGPAATYWPADLNTSCCIFCGYEALVGYPMMFYAFDRARVVYYLPERSDRPRDELVDLYRPILEDVRTSYMSRLPKDVRVAFNRAPELLAYTWNDFVYASHMGETIPEDHLCNVVGFLHGGGLIIDGAKRVIREVNADELDAIRRSPGFRETGTLKKSALLSALEQVDDQIKRGSRDVMAWFTQAQLNAVVGLAHGAGMLDAATDDCIGWRGMIRF
ncbi:MAG TPA: hypothetical protein VGW38_28985 [Chloroflexota bacterium]|nr:hypothetical protein [Chloroflexota bacterium]